VTVVPLLAALTDNLPALLVVGFFLVMTVVQQLVAGKKAFDKAVVRQRSERGATGSAGAQPPPAQPVQPFVYLRPDQPVAMPQNAGQARALLLAQIEAMANARGPSAQPSAVVQQPAPPQPSAVQAAPQQAAVARQRHAPRQRPAVSQDLGSFATLPGTLETVVTPSGLLGAPGAARAPSTTRRMLATVFGDPAHARGAVILAEVLGTPLGLR
jgi:hypothetical protein